MTYLPDTATCRACRHDRRQASMHALLGRAARSRGVLKKCIQKKTKGRPCCSAAHSTHRALTVRTRKVTLRQSSRQAAWEHTPSSATKAAAALPHCLTL